MHTPPGDCARYHGVDLKGGEHAPARLGEVFRHHWAQKSARKVYSRIISTMPGDNPANLTEPEARLIAVHCLTVNGASLGERPIESAAALDNIKLEWPRGPGLAQ
jgi:hypothetical protein